MDGVALGGFVSVLLGVVETGVVEAAGCQEDRCGVVRVGGCWEGVGTDDA